MALEQIGLEAILKDENFQAGLKRYTDGIGQMSNVTDSGASALSRIGSAMSGAFVVSIGAATAALGAFVAMSKVGFDAVNDMIEPLDLLGDMFGMNGEEASKWSIAMQHVGLTVQEGAAGLNFFTKNLDDAKKAGAGGLVPAKSAEQIGKLKEQLADANTQLQRAQKKFAEAKKPTDAMKYAVEDAQKKVNRLNAELKDGSRLVAGKAEEMTPFQKALDKLGVSAFDSKGKLKTFDDIMPEVMDKFEKMPAGVNSTALAMDLFGARGGTKFLDFLRQGNAGLENAKKFAQDFGYEIESDVVDGMEKLGFAFNDMNLGLKSISVSMGFAVLPTIKELVAAINNILPAVSNWASVTAGYLQVALFRLSNWLRSNVVPVLQQMYNWIMNFGIPALRKFAQMVIDNVVPALQAIAKWVRDDVLPFLQRMAKVYEEVVYPQIKKFGDYLEKKVPEWQNEFRAFWREVEPVLRKFGAWLESEGVKALKTFFDEMEKLQPIQKEWIDLLDEMLSTAKDVFGGISDDANTEFPKLTDIVTLAMGRIADVTQTKLDLMKSLWGMATSFIKGDFQGFTTNMNTFNTAMLDNILSTVGIKLSDVKTAFSGAWNAILAGISEFSGKVAPEIGRAIGGAITEINNRFNEFTNAGRGVIQAIINGIGELANTIKTKILEPFANAILEIFRTDWMAWGAYVINRIISGLVSIADSIKQNIWTPFANAIVEIWRTDWLGWGAYVIGGLINGIARRAQEIYNSIFNPFSNAIADIKRLLGIASPSRVMAQIGAQMAAGLMQGFGNPTFNLATNAGQVPMLAGGGSAVYNSQSVNNYSYVLNVTTSAPASSVVSDFGILRSLSAA